MKKCRRATLPKLFYVAALSYKAKKAENHKVLRNQLIKISLRNPLKPYQL